eukprot:TRINITY_DN4786_c0_g2_i1.p2 TRINITY_DN4786_c0_g2~~TRINITY_DN4786_c0_g2_i1.p2  ORF type:complete len:307 (+),score=66.22 TRINITY_DN4786_c0_g2_i1:1097-2017(+)
MWSMLLLFMLELIAAIFLAQLLQSTISDPFVELAERQMLWRHFGTWINSMVSIFEITMAPGGFLRYREIIWEVHAGVYLFVMLYVCVVTFAIIRVMTSLFLKATLESCEKEEEFAAKLKNEERLHYADYLRTLVDVDGSGGLTFEELELLTELPQMQPWLLEIGLEAKEANRLFRALQRNGQEVRFADFVGALAQMRGNIRPCDHVVMLHELESVLDTVRGIEANLASSSASPTAASGFAGTPNASPGSAALTRNPLDDGGSASRSEGCKASAFVVPKALAHSSGAVASFRSASKSRAPPSALMTL